jgi:hypothetical protein
MATRVFLCPNTGADEETDDPLRDVKKAPGLLFPRL